MEGVSSPPRSRSDRFLVLATVAFAFLTASFAAANSDLWMHLAAGRLIGEGKYSFGKDPFSYHNFDRYWTNHSWLFDFALFKVFETVGGSAIVALKALGIAAAAAIMLRIASRNAGAGSVSDGRASTVAHASGSLLRDGGPVWLAAGCTLLAVLAMSPRLLVQPQCLSILLMALCLSWLVEGRRKLRWVPLLILLWVNLDAWFLLGPLLVLLFQLSEWLGWHKLDAPRWLLPASFLACLCSPHHVHGLTVPPELSWSVWTSPLRDDPRFASFFADPWRLAPYGRTGGYSLAAWAFPILLVGGLLSFALNRKAQRSWRFLVWLPFALLAAKQARLVPFFAVVGGPILALNLAEVLNPNRGLRWGHRLVGLFAIALLILSWPGWLQGFYVRDRSLAWRLAPDPSLVHAAERIRSYNTPAVYHTNPDVAHYLAWFAPGLWSGIDSRLQLFTAIEVTDKPEFGIVTVTEVPKDASLDEVAGSYVLVDLRTPRPRFDPERQAFGPPDAFAEAPIAAPESLPDPEAPPFWDLNAHRQRGRTWEGDAAPTLLRLFEQQKGTERSPALPLLAVRCARNGLVQQPLGDDAWFALARAYLTLGRGTWEPVAGADLTLLRYLRHTQVVGSLRQAVTLNPDSLGAHEQLAVAFAERRLFDLALHHRREQMRLVRRAGLAAGETPESRAERLAQLQELIDRLERLVQDGENLFRVRTFDLAGSPLERARMARDFGLGATALDTLERSHPDLYGVPGLQLLLDLMLQTGRLSDARLLLDRDELKRRSDSLDLFKLPGGVKDDKPWRYSLPAFDWFDLCQSAAAGRYDRAEIALERLREHLLKLEEFALPEVRLIHLRTALGELGAPFLLHRGAVLVEREYWGWNVNQTRFLTAVRGDLHVLGGLLHLERGAVREADREFGLALDRYAETAGPGALHPGRPMAVKYRELLRAK